MNSKRLALVTVVIAALTLLTACNSNSNSNQETKRGAFFDITGTWNSKSNSDGYELEITIDSTDFTEGQESVKANATFTFDKLSDDWRSKERTTIHLKDSDFSVRYRLITNDAGHVLSQATVSFKYGSPISDMVTITFNENGTAQFEVALKGTYDLVRK